MNYFISRHSGAIQWAKQHLHIDRFITHLNINEIQAGDEVYGTLPVNLAAQCCKKGALYFHLNLTLPEELRGKELTHTQMETLDANVTQYDIKEMP
ncbi:MULTISPECIES: CRISPR-associated protein Csx16 [unclassified Pseudoalteromonas]|uniref:CRISPR-associated protein Csx16 n=1 Tax=unclassified Pseudoalteromonas TaxID=194690 RepID=UPI001BABC759|nr:MULTISPECIES: CRISPR-associated protein Csx16 [unclassified Pseudoalteromonas]